MCQTFDTAIPQHCTVIYKYTHTHTRTHTKTPQFFNKFTILCWAADMFRTQQDDRARKRQ